MPDTPSHTVERGSYEEAKLDVTDQERQRQLGAVLHGRLDVVRSATNGRIAVMVPTFENAERRLTMAHTLQSISQQRIPDLDLFIGSDALQGDTQEYLRGVIARLPHPVHFRGFLEVAPPAGKPHSPSNSRNRAVEQLCALATTDYHYRYTSIVFGDDDATFGRGSLALLRDVHRRHSDAVAVLPKIELVPGQNELLYSREPAPNGRLPDEHVVEMGGLWKPSGDLDIMKVVGFGSDVCTKTCGLLVDGPTLHALQRKSGQVFAEMPRLSGEDMVLSTCIDRFGKILRQDQAVVYDMMRSKSEQVRKQRAAWGEDHVHLAHDLRDLGLLGKKGLHVLEPDYQQSRWLSWEVPDSAGLQYVINPGQLASVLSHLKLAIGDDAEGFLRPFCVEMDAEDLYQAIESLESLLRRVAELRPHAQYTADGRSLPEPARIDDENLRFSSDAMLGLLVGNMTGNMKRGSVASPLLYGLRQAVSHEHDPHR